MAIAPDPHLAACLAVLERAFVQARQIAAHGTSGGLPESQAQQIADLMDAVHNIPALVQRWESCDQSLLRKLLLECDRRWPDTSDLDATYERALARRE